MQNVVSPTSEIFERLKCARGLQNDADLAREMGVPPKKLGVWKLRNTVPLNELTTYCRRFYFNLEAVLTGEGEIHQPLPEGVAEGRGDYRIKGRVGGQEIVIECKVQTDHGMVVIDEQHRAMVELMETAPKKKNELLALVRGYLAGRASTAGHNGDGNK